MEVNQDTNFLHKLLLTKTQVPEIHKNFVNGSPANVKSPKTQLSKIVQLWGVLSDIPIFGNILSSVAKKETGIDGNLGEKILDKQMNKFKNTVNPLEWSCLLKNAIFYD